MTEERKFAILIAATILSARKLAELEDQTNLLRRKSGPSKTAIRHAAYILGEIDKKWPTKAPAAFTNLGVTQTHFRLLETGHFTVEFLPRGSTFLNGSGVIFSKGANVIDQLPSFLA